MRIHDILVRIRIRGSGPLTSGWLADPDSDPAEDPDILVSDLQDGNKK